MTLSLPTHLPVVDHDELHQRMMGNALLAERMLNKFVATAPAECDQLESAIRIGDKSTVTSLAHRHKGTAKTLATHRVAAAASHLEERAATDSVSELLALLEELRQLHQEVRDVVGGESTCSAPENGAQRP
ncbi:Hpt domain-containing protein [Roseimaritima sediminicola]|uniref:Hpt domain-containing protein n=1 Tax=Roseimaritima sediminicola TaxID=2662066 RepID=UPI0012985806|nr:Hpt domain-containing protein [Roseimaritima sediminicola]